MAAPMAVNFPPETEALAVPDGCRLEGMFSGARTTFARPGSQWRECGFKESTLCWDGNAGPVDSRTFLFVVFDAGYEEAANDFAATMRQRGFERTVAVSAEDV